MSEKESLIEKEKEILEKEGEEGLARFYRANQELYLKTEEPAKRRTLTRRVGAKLGRNQNLILFLLRKHPLPAAALLEQFTLALFPAPVLPEQSRRAKMLLRQAVRMLKRRKLVKIDEACLALSRRHDKTVQLTEEGHDLSYCRKAAALENIIANLLNRHLQHGERAVTTAGILEELAQAGVSGPNVNATRVGRILRKYGHRTKTHGKRVYLLPEDRYSPPANHKNTKKNWRKGLRWVDTGLGLVPY